MPLAAPGSCQHTCSRHQALKETVSTTCGKWQLPVEASASGRVQATLLVAAICQGHCL